MIDLSYKLTPHVVFLTNQDEKEHVLKFIADTKFINMYQDFKHSVSHLNDSTSFNFKYAEKTHKKSGDIDTSRIAELKTTESLLDQGYLMPLDRIQSSRAVCVIKPNQPFNAVLRSLKSIANINAGSLTPKDPNYAKISKIEFVPKYSDAQIDLLFNHDIMYDENISNSQKQRMKNQF